MPHAGTKAPTNVEHIINRLLEPSVSGGAMEKGRERIVFIGPSQSRSALMKNMNGGPAPQYDFCGQRGPAKREMSQGDSAKVRQWRLLCFATAY